MNPRAPFGALALQASPLDRSGTPAHIYDKSVSGLYFLIRRKPGLQDKWVDPLLLKQPDVLKLYLYLHPYLRRNSNPYQLLHYSFILGYV